MGLRGDAGRRRTIPEPQHHLRMLDAGSWVTDEPGVRGLECLGERPDRQPARGGEQQHALQRLTGPQPVSPAPETRGKHRELRGRLEPRIVRPGRAAGRA